MVCNVFDWKRRELMFPIVRIEAVTALRNIYEQEVFPKTTWPVRNAHDDDDSSYVTIDSSPGGVNVTF